MRNSKRGVNKKKYIRYMDVNEKNLIEYTLYVRFNAKIRDYIMK